MSQYSNIFKGQSLWILMIRQINEINGLIIISKTIMLRV